MDFQAHLGSCNEYSQNAPIWKPAWIIFHENGFFHIQDWTAVPEDDKIIARKVYDRSKPLNAESSATEYTVIEIRFDQVKRRVWD